MQRLKRAALILSLLPLSAVAADAPPPYWQAVSYIEAFKALKVLPPWADFEDDWRFLTSADSKRKVVCIQDRATGQRFTSTGDLKKFIAGTQNPAVALLELWETNAAPRPRALAVDVELCWPQAGPVSYFPVTLGEPAYRAIVHTRPDRTAPLDWATMGTFVVGTPQAGLACSVTRIAEPTEHPDPSVGWHHAPGGGITRCRSM